MSSTTPLDTLRPILQTYSVLAITLAAGTNLSSTIVTLPALLQSPPATLAKQWKILFDHGITPVVALTLSSAAGFATLAYNAALTPSVTATGLVSHRARNLYAVAALLGVGLAPYTQILMGSVNAELASRAERGEKGGESGTRGLVEKWGRLNLARGCMLLASAGVGMWARVQ
ncbi:hypothetical protein C7974DRAFT_40721 [Boeremia exigua]|uniref:uncharacterized protein n=1 Tax=Boeremia exigua TaxID=749465 RepID=UPI001E8CE504|nr:uncharacterized protein C7974DRAFT_40721 [Boeremia exigua]KAH6619039.1 hypothetical protein C7974DRAFT_40721 [Boeremia exigua]